MRLEIQRTLELRVLGLKCGAQAAIEFWIVGLPNFVTGLNAAKVNVTSPKCQDDFLYFLRMAAGISDFIHPSAFFFLVRMSRIKHDPVAGF